MTKDQFGLPRQLGDGLLLRWASADDVETLAEFNFRMHNDNPDGQPELWLKDWTRALMSGQHPTTCASDFTLVEDRVKGGKIVSAMVLISQTWSYDGVSFGCGRPELVGTAADYRRRGLIRAQFDAVHKKSTARHELVQAIAGIPWYYRQFGYEMALELDGKRHLQFAKLPSLAKGQKEGFQLRQATLDDLTVLAELYDGQAARSLISCVRDEAIWRYELRDELEVEATESGVRWRDLKIVETVGGEVVAYAEIPSFPRMSVISELVVRPGMSVREVSLFVARYLKSMTDATDETSQSTGIDFKVGTKHPLHEALKEELEPRRLPYAWYIRVPDLAAFLVRIAPVLEKRLAKSELEGYSGALRLNFYRSHLEVVFREGRLLTVRVYRPKDFFDGDGFFPELTFLQLLFGHRSLADLKYAHADCFTSRDDASKLLGVLFPRRYSEVVPLS